nr:hypothetical protein [Tanacetum cinerariifolium]
MSSGSQNTGDAVVSKFDIHVYTFILTSDEVKNLVTEYVIPLDLHPCVPFSGLTMNRLSIDKIALSNIFAVIGSPLNVVRGKEVNRHQASGVVDPAFTGVCTEDIRRLCKNVIDLCPVHPAMLYAIGLTTIWKHVGHHLVFKDGEGNGNIMALPLFVKGTALVAREAIPYHTNLPLPFGSQIPKKYDHQRVVEYENEMVLAAKRKAQAAKDKADRKRAATEGASQRTKKNKTGPLSFALSDSEEDESSHSGSRTHHSASPLNTIISNETEPVTRGDGLILESVTRAKEDIDQPLDNVEDTTEVNTFLFEHSLCFQHSNPSDEEKHNVRSEPARTYASGSIERFLASLPSSSLYFSKSSYLILLFLGHGVSSSFGGSHRRAFPRRNPGGDGSSLRRDVSLPEPFVPTWNLTTHSILNDAKSFQYMMVNLDTPAVRSQQSRLSDYQALQRSWFELGHEALTQINILQRYEALNEDYEELFESHRSCRDVSDRLTETQNQLLDARDDLLDKDQEREERIKQLEADLASKTSSLTAEEGVVNIIKGDLECLTVDLGQAEIVRHNYVRQLLLTVVQRLLSSGGYNKSLTDVFNLAIAAGWLQEYMARPALSGNVADAANVADA